MAEATFLDRVEERTLTIGVVGLGYVGLPLAVSYAESGFVVLGFDVDEERCASLNAGQSHIDDVTHERVTAVRDGGMFEASAGASDLERADVIFICVPTPFDPTKTPDLTFVRQATETVASVLREGMLVILQSTTYPGTTREIVLPALESRGLTAGSDFHVAFSPERVDPGNTTWTVHNTPKVVGRASCSRRSWMTPASYES